MSRCVLAGYLLAALLTLALPEGAAASAFCDCCCNAAAGTGAFCPGCDVDGNGSLTRDEVRLLGCVGNPICAAVFPACIGDCDGNDEVTIDERVAMVSAALGAVNPAACAADDANTDGAITVDEIIRAVNNAVSHCPVATPAATATSTNTQPSVTATMQPSDTPRATATPSPVPMMTVTMTSTPSPSSSAGVLSPTPTTTVISTASATGSQAVQTSTPSPTPTTIPTVMASATVAATPTATSTSGDPAVAESVAGGAVLVANGMAAIPSVVTALVSGLQFGASAAAISSDALQFGVTRAAGACPLGGTATRACTGTGSVTLTLTLSACQVPTGSGSVSVDGTITIKGGGFCPTLVLPPWNATVDIEATFKNAGGTATLLTARANLTGTINPQLGGSCNATGADLVLSGTIDTDYPGKGSVEIGFINTSVGIAVSAFNAQCVPVKYVLTLNGSATLSAGLAGRRAAPAAADSTLVRFDAFTISQDASSDPTQTRLNGHINAACFGGTITLETLAALAQAVGEPCPSDGTIKLTAPQGPSQIFYLAGGGVGLDTNLDGFSEETFESCLDAQLQRCVGPTPSATPSASATPTATGFPTATPSPISTPSASAAPTATAVPTATPSPTPTPSASAAPTATTAPIVTPSPTPTPDISPLPTPTPSPSVTPTGTGLSTATPSPTATPGTSPLPTPTPSASAPPTATAPPTPTPSPTPSPSPAVSAIPSASPTQTAPQTLFCDSLSTPALIPDNSPAGITNTILLADPTIISDLNVKLDIAHTWVGDLVVTLTHLNSRTDTVRLLNRPGTPEAQNGCSGDDISVTLDDTASSPVHYACASGTPTIGGRLYPENPLSAFNGDALEGAWQLNVSDNAMDDTGSLLGWCLEVNTAPASPPPVVTDFTCDDMLAQCVVVIGDPFTLTFSFTDPDNNAVRWRIRVRRDDGFEFEAGQGTLTPSGSGTIPVTFNPFTCTGTCRDTEFDYFITVIDADGHASTERSVHLIVTQFIV